MVMKSAKLLALVVAAPLLLASTAAFADETKAPKKKPKSSVSSKGPKKTAPQPVEMAPDPEPTPAPVAAPAPVAPETKAADSKPAEVKPVPVGADRPGDERNVDDPDNGKHWTAAPLLGFGTNNLNFGVGVRGGYTLSQHVYVGAAFMYHFGTSYSYGGYLGGAANEISVHALYPSGEVGYDFHVGPVTIRPYGGVGIGFVTASSTLANVSGSATNSSLVIYPGATAFWNIPRSDFFVGGDTRMLILTRGGDPSFGLFASAGMHF
jgi:hypothetical protein